MRLRIPVSFPFRAVHACLAICALSVSSTAIAQCAAPCFAMFDDATFDDRSSTSGGLILAIQFQVSSPVSAQRIELFTGESTGTTTLSLWSHDTTTNTPGMILTSGTYPQALTKAWQGANLGKTVVLLPNTNYWIGTEYRSSSQISARGRAANNSGQPYRASRDAGKTWGSEFRQWEWKFRIFCCRKQSPIFVTFGNSCGPRGVAPQLSGTGLPIVGKTYSVDVRSTSTNAPVLLTLGVSKTLYGALKLPFDLTPLGATGCTLLCSVEATAVGSIGASSMASFPVPIPQNNALLGARFFHQAWLVVSVANPLGIAFSNAAEVVIGQ